MKPAMRAGFCAAMTMVFWLGCAESGSDKSAAIGFDSIAMLVNLQNETLEIRGGGQNQITTMTGHTVEIKNGPAGCSWDAGTSTLTCEILFRNLDSDECMTNVRTRLHNSTDPSANVNNADYIWPGPTIDPNSNLPINESGYCITDSNPSSAGSAEGCADTWQDNIPPGAIATQFFAFTGVKTESYTVYLQIMADYYECSAPEGMARIPAGCFRMGDTFNQGLADEKPAHDVCITSDFFMDRYEVTNAEYAACVSAGACIAPAYAFSSSRSSYYGDPDYADFPVIWVSWNKATAYCAWRGKRLPTEAQWEYAARGGLDGKRYPWGDAVTGADANYYDSGDPWDNDTSPAGSYPANGYGLYDMAGNVWEWVADRYGSTYYSISPVDDPAGPDTGANRGLRGESWSADTAYLRVSKRLNLDPPTSGPHIGFRCARD